MTHIDRKTESKKRLQIEKLKVKKDFKSTMKDNLSFIIWPRQWCEIKNKKKNDIKLTEV